MMLPASITPEELISFFNDRRYNTNQARDLTRGYIGQRMRYSGQINDVHSSITFFENAQGQLGPVRAHFDPKLVSQISVFPPGKNLTIVGRIDAISSYDVELRDCEIVAD
jgi:hypothetical protein